MSYRAAEREHAATTEQVPRREPVGGEPAPRRVLALQRSAGNRATARLLQRELQVRPPGPGEATAYDRRQELLDRLERPVRRSTSTTLDEPAARRAILRYTIVDNAALTNFDRRMIDFIDLVPVIPMRLINRTGYVGGEPLRMDSLQEAYVDIDDLLSSTDLGFQLILIHFLTERSRVHNYERRIGTPMPEFDVAHRAGREAEAEHLRSLIGDPTIRYVYEERRDPANPATSRYVIGFRSRAERYWVFQVYAPTGRRTASAAAPSSSRCPTGGASPSKSDRRARPSRARPRARARACSCALNRFGYMPMAWKPEST